MKPQYLLPARFGHGAEGEFRFHPLICHMLDVASVAQRLWDEVLPAQSAVAESLGLTPTAARRWCAFLAGLHDLGKASPAFLAHRAAAEMRPLLSPSFRLDDPSVVPTQAPHGRVTTLALQEFLADRFEMSPDTARRFAVISGGHHGQDQVCRSLRRPGLM